MKILKDIRHFGIVPKICGTVPKMSDGQTDRWTDGPTDKGTDGQTDRQTSKNCDIETESPVPGIL